MAELAKEYKYKELMVEKKVKDPCPLADAKEAELSAYHWGFSPKDDENNFLPGHKKRRRINAKTDEVNCRYCGLSMFKSIEGATDKWWKEIDDNVRDMLKFTHLLGGDIKREFGVVSIDKSEHFTLFEYEGIDLREHFEVIDELVKWKN